jgi:hypothetical protein
MIGYATDAEFASNVALRSPAAIQALHVPDRLPLKSTSELLQPSSENDSLAYLDNIFYQDRIGR